MIQKVYYVQCIACGSLNVGENLFCEHCYYKNFAKYLKRWLPRLFCPDGSREEIKIFHLINWIPGESDLLSSYIYCLKGIKAQKAWAFWAKIFHQTLLVERATELREKAGLGRICIVPLPGSKLTSRHSYFFATELARLTGLPVVDIIRPPNLAFLPQKKQNKQMRQGRKLSLREEFTNQNHILFAEGRHQNRQNINLHIIFVDDICTTGATVAAGLKAIRQAHPGQILTCEVWSLFSRSL